MQKEVLHVDLQFLQARQKLHILLFSEFMSAVPTLNNGWMDGSDVLR